MAFLQWRLALRDFPGLERTVLGVNRRVSKPSRQLANKRQQLLRLLRHSVRLLQNIGKPHPGGLGPWGVFVW